MTTRTPREQEIYGIALRAGCTRERAMERVEQHRRTMEWNASLDPVPGLGTEEHGQQYSTRRFRNRLDTED